MTEGDRDIGGEVRLGSMLFTLVEQHRGHEVAYNRWYERDHFYAGCMVGPWLFAGRRFVATRPMKDLRFGAEPDIFGDVGLGSYLAVYWVLDGHHDDHFDWALRQVRWLHANGRMFPERDHVHTLLYRHAVTTVGALDSVPAELALDHPFGGLIATVVEPAEDRDAELVASYLSSGAAQSLQLGFSPIPLDPDAPVTQQGVDRMAGCLMFLTFTNAPPEQAWEGHRAAGADIERKGMGRVLWSAPFIPTIPGTDTYTDQLW